VDEILGYIKYILDTAWFNLAWYKWHLGADIKVFENCSWRNYKENKELGESQ